MNRKQFIKMSSLAALFTQTSVIGQVAGFFEAPAANIDPSTLPTLSPAISNDFIELLNWMKNNQWDEIISTITGINLNTTNPVHESLFREVTPMIQNEGLNDFAGRRLIEPGKPQLSLLYHLMAHPLSKSKQPGNSNTYPSLEQLDLLENVIYGLQGTKNLVDGNTVIAVFAYEYRPACKTPHLSHADMVFARTGFARVGNQPLSEYDKINRCYTNQPVHGSEKDIAVYPARYGAFLAKVVNFSGVHKTKTSGASVDVMPQFPDIIRSDGQGTYQFLLPIRKLFKNDSLLNNADIFFVECHLNEKLKRVTEHQKLPASVSFNTEKAPFKKISNSSTEPGSVFSGDKTMVSLVSMGSSVLLCSQPHPLVSPAYQLVNNKKERLRVSIPVVEKPDIFEATNRRYTSFKLTPKPGQKRDAYDAVVSAILYKGRTITNYHVPRDAPMFLNIREQVNELTGELEYYLGPEENDLQNKIDQSYFAGLFEDNICDGCVTVQIKGVASQLNNLPVFAAFSVVTAPDFFPLINSADLLEYEDMFMVGGVEDMAGGVLRANPNIPLPGSNELAFPVHGGANNIRETVAQTVMRAVSYPSEFLLRMNNEVRKRQNRQLTSTTFLPDSATRIFFPGWDITYAGEKEMGNIENIRFYASYGLGSPFVEDSKLCAAVNGMWAAASPDAARTFRSSLTKVRKSVINSNYPPTAIPLLDRELGYHPQSPYHLDYGMNAIKGWDGEEGPFISISNTNAVVINFVEIGRADYVHNAIDGLFDMSQMRGLTIAEVLARMDALNRCYQWEDRPLKKKFWLVGVEKVDDWSFGAHGYCIPKRLVGGSNNWATNSRLTSNGSGYLFLFVKTKSDYTRQLDSKRCIQDCLEIIVAQVNETSQRFCSLSLTDDSLTPVWM